MDGRKNNRGTEGNNGGNPGFGALKLIRNNVKKHCPKWWDAWKKDMKSEKFEQRRVAMQEFNKLQVKLMPTVMANDDDSPLILQFDKPFKKDESLTVTSKTERDNKLKKKI